MENINYVINSNFQKKITASSELEIFSIDKALQAASFLKSFPQYSPTPLVNLSGLAKELGVKGLFVKDESKRFGLNAFKVLGSAYALGCFLAEKLGLKIEGLTLDLLREESKKQNLPKIIFTTATDGNHGRGLAWAARYLSHDAIIYMPAGSAHSRIANIEATGAKVIVTEFNYDRTVELARTEAIRQGRQLVQDTISDGNEQIPRWIMQGYTVIAAEALEQLQAHNSQNPTHLLLQCGVGSFPAAMIASFTSAVNEEKLLSAIVEPNRADPFFRSALAADGTAKTVDGALDTIMAGLACGVPNPLAWEIARDYCAAFFSCPDYVAAYGMRLLGSPLQGDQQIISGESGALTAGLLALLMQKETQRKAAANLGLGKDSIVLLVSTEGDTDPLMYRRVTWEGAYSLPDHY
ncbi:MAG: diaminopropionate ammonia-lyase [Firmicutes bacterium]|nr:diaminopropionate ammonia-lyase [Bacillota bacterium]